jgi:hypothetical protein
MFITISPVATTGRDELRHQILRNLLRIAYHGVRPTFGGGTFLLPETQTGWPYEFQRA